ncbi:MAG: V-type ATP synthase subunit E [bacterium]
MGGVGSLDTIRNEILKQAKEQSLSILDRAQRISERDLEFAREEAEEIIQQQRAKIQPSIDMEIKKITASAEMEARKILLQKKEELVSRIFDEARRKLEEMHGSDFYINLIVKSIIDGVSTIGNELDIEFGEQDKNIFTSEMLSSIESRIKKTLNQNVKLNFKCVGNEISAGIIIKSKDGRVILDNSFSSLIRRLKEELRGKISEILLENK